MFGKKVTRKKVKSVLLWFQRINVALRLISRGSEKFEVFYEIRRCVVSV